MQLEDGTGNGFKVEVDKDKRLHASVISESQSDHHSELGYRYNVNTGIINLTDATESAVFYFKNNESDDIVINTLIYNFGICTGGTDEVTIDVFKNTTGGTIVSDATAVDMNVNMNFGSSKTLVVDAYKGAQGKTQTGGVQAVSSFSGLAANRVVISSLGLILTKGDSISVTVTPATSNTSLNVQVAAALFLQQLSV